MLPNFTYHTFLPYVRSLMRAGDMLLLSANLSPGLYADAVAQLLPQYDNPFAYAWYTGLLDSLGFTASQIQLAVHTQLLRPDGHIWQIRAAATVRQPVQLILYDEVFPFTTGESLEVFFSTRFTPQVMPEVLAEAGLTLLDTHVTSLIAAAFLCATVAVGSLIVQEHCRRLDRAREVGYLETDKRQNVHFYERFGFEVIAEEPVIGVPNWFMRREPRSADS
jgi:hypothetical protein